MDFNRLFGTPAQQAALPRPADAGLFAGSELRRLIGHRYVDGFARLIALPFWLADPRVLMALAHSAGLTQPPALLAESGQVLFDERLAGRVIGHLGRVGLGVQQVVFLGADEAYATAEHIRTVHAGVKGTLGFDFGANYPADTLYHASDPELCDWVNGWYLHGLLQAAQAFGVAIEDPGSLYDEARYLFELLGSPDLPPTLEAFTVGLDLSLLARAATTKLTIWVHTLFLMASLDDPLLPNRRAWSEMVLELVGPVIREPYGLQRRGWQPKRQQEAQAMIAQLAKRLSEQPSDFAATPLRTLQPF